jgi:type VII secretion-associated protein (TIGR03931 family)
VNPATVEVGPHTIRGPNDAPQEWSSVAIECVDDQIALLDGRLVEVRELWSDVLDTVAGGRAETLVLVFPTWWSQARIELVAEAARGVAADVVVLQRASVLGADGDESVLELSEEFLVIAPPGSGVTVLARGERDVAAYLGATPTVLVDVPAGVSPLAPALTAQLRAAGVAVAHSDRRRLLRAVSTALPEPDGGEAPTRRRELAVFAGVALSVAAIGGGWAAQALSGRPQAATTLLVEGRVSVRVPAQWAVERITSGPGSARVRVSAPTDHLTALHITQSTGATSTTIAEVAESLRRAFESEPRGVFTEFDAAGSVSGRPAVTYREIRAGSETNWAVVIDAEMRIAIGCQSPPAGRDAIHDSCLRAVESAHVVR